jgi:hypothetical protein
MSRAREVDMLTFLPKRMTAKAADRSRTKIAIITEATADLKLALPLESLRPFKQHFHPEENRSHRWESIAAVNAIPLEHQVSSIKLIVFTPIHVLVR